MIKNEYGNLNGMYCMLMYKAILSDTTYQALKESGIKNVFLDLFFDLRNLELDQTIN